MSLQSLRQQSWLRATLVALMLCFALGSIAHAGHSHDQSKAHTHVVCDFCVSFTSLIDASPSIAVAAIAPPVSQLIVIADSGFIAVRPVSVAQARAPPVSC